jgi:hypothetical protein
LLAILPHSLSMQFTHHLTYCCGLTDCVVALMYAFFLHGIGPVPFANMIHTMHIHHYEKLHLQYREMICVQLKSTIMAMIGKLKPSSLSADQDGYAGFTPSAKYFWDFYVNFISSHASEIDQYTAMLSAKILAIDHSFKV